MALSLIGANTTSAATGSITSHQVGDLILIFAYNNTSTTIPTIPTASGTVPAWVNLINNAGANSNALRVCYFVATATNTTVGTWTNATGMGIVVLRGQAGSPFGGTSEAGSTASNAATAPSVTLTHNDGTSILVEFVGHTSVTAWSTAPSGYTRQANTASRCAVFTKNSSTSDGAETFAATTSSNSGYRGATLEVLDPAGSFILASPSAFFNFL